MRRFIRGGWIYRRHTAYGFRIVAARAILPTFKPRWRDSTGGRGCFFFFLLSWKLRWQHVVIYVPRRYSWLWNRNIKRGPEKWLVWKRGTRATHDGGRMSRRVALFEVLLCWLFLLEVMAKWEERFHSRCKKPLSHSSTQSNATLRYLNLKRCHQETCSVRLLHVK